MNASGSDPVDGEAPFVEGDAHETKLGYGEGGVPFYVGIIWVLFLVAYVAIMTTLALPDLRAWISR